ncbi:MAG: alpha/beta hydrolase [Pseudomonadota bacterium]
MAAFGVYLWTLLPVKIDRQTQDPAFAHLANDAKNLASFQEGYFEHAGYTLHYVSAGEGEAIVFFHGFPSFWYSFARQVDRFGTDYRVIAVDGLGAGKSDAPYEVEPYELEAMGEHIVALLDELDIQRAHLVGHDWGSAFAIGLAQRYPERVMSVTGISAPPMNATLYAFEVDPKARETSGYVERFKQASAPLLAMLGVADQIYNDAYRPLVEDGKLTPEEGELFRTATSNPKRTNAHINWYRANVPHPDALSEADFWPSRYARVTMPALYIWGEDDPIYNQTALDRLTELSDQSEVLMLPETGHWPHVRNVKAVNAAIEAHIKTASDRSTTTD